MNNKINGENMETNMGSHKKKHGKGRNSETHSLTGKQGNLKWEKEIISKTR